MNKLLLILAGTLLLETTVMYANTALQTEKLTIPKQKTLRYMDTKEEYGKSCESYSYISPEERLKFVKHSDFMLGDILTESLSISKVDPEYLMETNLTECSVEGLDVSVYTYEEDLEFLGEDIVTIKVYQYTYGAGATHGNGHISHYVYNRDYGMKVKWKDLFGSNKKFDLYVLKRVINEIADAKYIAYFKTKEQLLNFRQPGYFAITEEGLLIQYGKYEITPGASGLPSLTIPKEVIKQYMNQEMYAKCFLTEKPSIAEVLDEF